MGVSFLPSTELGLLSWSANFAVKVAEDPEFWGVSVEQSDAFVSLQAAFADALNVTTDPGARTRASVIIKNEAAESLRVAARQIANVINGQPDVSDADRFALGLTVRAARSNNGTPTDRPVIGLQLVHGRAVTITLFQSDTNARRLPAGVSGAILFRHVGDDLPTTRGEWQFFTLTGQTSIDVTFGEDVPSGAQVWFTAAWFSHRKELGPQATPASIHLAGGPVMAFNRSTAIRRAA